MDKHAYLIMAHKDDLALRTLVELLDNEKHDIYIHMDKKTKNYDPKCVSSLVQHSSIYHVERMDVVWGGL